MVIFLMNKINIIFVTIYLFTRSFKKSITCSYGLIIINFVGAFGNAYICISNLTQFPNQFTIGALSQKLAQAPSSILLTHSILFATNVLALHLPLHCPRKRYGFILCLTRGYKPECSFCWPASLNTVYVLYTVVQYE